MKLRFVYGDWPELERIELGDRVSQTYDESFQVAYRLGAAAGLERREVPLSWQSSFQDWDLGWRPE